MEEEREKPSEVWSRQLDGGGIVAIRFRGIDVKVSQYDDLLSLKHLGAVINRGFHGSKLWLRKWMWLLLF